MRRRRGGSHRGDTAESRRPRRGRTIGGKSYDQRVKTELGKIDIEDVFAAREHVLDVDLPQLGFHALIVAFPADSSPASRASTFGGIASMRATAPSAHVARLCAYPRS